MCYLVVDDYLCGCLFLVDITHCDQPTCWSRDFDKDLLVEECENRTGGCSRIGTLPVAKERSQKPEKKKKTGRDVLKKVEVDLKARDEEKTGREKGSEGEKAEGETAGEEFKVRTWWGLEM